MADFDLAIVGGGINGAGIARDAAGRGFRVLLVEQNDLGSGTSSASSKLIHGGLRYLEQGEFRLVREALAEREVLLRMAPHLVQPLRLILPAEPGLRPAWLLRLGLFVYDHLGGRKLLPGTRTLDLSRDPLGAALKGRYRYGFEYSDCRTDDARLVVLNALDAAERGALIRTRTRCVEAQCVDGAWSLVLEVRGRRDVATARVLVNAAGPWAAHFNETVLQRPPLRHFRLDKGSHIVVRRLFDHDRGYMFQTIDRRVVFALPFEGDFTLIGTTDRRFSGDPGGVAPDADEIDYLCKAANDHFRTRISPADVVFAFAGVRSLYDDGALKSQDVTRDYVLALDEEGGAPLLTLYGGKITTYRRLAEAALDRLGAVLGSRPAWTKDAALPGGDIAPGALESLIAETCKAWPFLAEAHIRRLVHAYGTRVTRLLGSAEKPDDLGPRFGADLTAAEVIYLMSREWAQSEDDVLWRRSKLGLRFSREERARLATFMAGMIGRRDDDARN
jgi:glycerol-3-phosphate dehydrogenase